jgi:hypothetical protein
MAVKFKITKAQYDALSDELKKEYVAGDTDGEFVLDVNGLPEPEDTGPLKRGLEAEKNKTKELKRSLDEAKAKLADVPDVEAINKAHAEEKAKLTKFVDKTLKESVANGLAAKISTAPTLLAPKIAERIAVDMTGDEPKTVFLGKDGKPDANLTLEKIRDEVVANPEYKSIIIASKASGGGAPVSTIKPLGGGAPKDGEQGKFDASTASGKDLAAAIAAKKEAAAQQQ